MFKLTKNKRIADLKQAIGPLKLVLSKIEMAVSSLFFNEQFVLYTCFIPLIAISTF